MFISCSIKLVNAKCEKNQITLISVNIIFPATKSEFCLHDYFKLNLITQEDLKNDFVGLGTVIIYGEGFEPQL